MTAEKTGILIVEDDGILAWNLQETLRDMGYAILSVVASGEESVALARKCPPDLILMDIELAGELNGIRAAETIRSFSDVPIIFLTGYSQETLIQKAKSAAPSGYLIKPVPARELQATIEMALHRHVLDRRLKESEERAKALAETLEVIFDATPVIMMLLDKEGRVQAINRAGAVFSGTPREKALGALGGEVIRCLTSFDTEGCGRGEKCLSCPVRSSVMGIFDTGKTVCDVEGSLTLAREGIPVTFVFLISTALVTIDKETMALITVTDITERKKLEEERLEVERRMQNILRLESLATAAAGVAHGFNNILTGVYGNMEMALRKLDADSPARIFVEDALRSSEQAIALSGQMLAFTGQGYKKRIITDLNELARSEADAAIKEGLSAASIIFDIHPSPVRVLADPRQIRQVVRNLLTNSLESVSGPECVITLSTGIIQCTAQGLESSRITEKPAEGMYAYLDVRDNGQGMDKQTQTRVFDPFFSTKFTGRGLGMPAVYGIVKGHGGAIMLDSQQDLGTTVRVLFPLAE